MWKKIVLIITAGMWILALGQLFFVNKADSMRARQEVFHTINEEQASYEVQMTGQYKNGFLTREEEKDYLTNWAEQLEFSLDKISYDDVENGHVTYGNLEGKNITGHCKIITREEKISEQAFHCTQYISYSLTSKENLVEMMMLRDMLHEFVEEVQIDSIPLLVAEYESSSKMTEQEQTSLVHSIAKSMRGTIVNSVVEQSNYFVYGYSRDLAYSQNIDGKDMNFLIYMKPSDNGRIRIHLQFPTVSLT